MAYYRDVEDDIARGLVSGAVAFGSYGKIVTIGAVSNQVIWPNGTWAVPPQTGISPEVVSSSASDDKDAGTGIRSIKIHYIDTNYNEQTTIVELEGLTPVSLGISDLVFVQCMHMITYGSSKAAVGNIVLREIGETQNYSYISIGENRCSSSARMIPAGKRLILRQAFGASTSGAGQSKTNISISATMFDDYSYLDDSVLIPYFNIGFQDQSFGQEFSPPLVFLEKTVIAMVATSDKAATISGAWNGFLEPIPTNAT
jgi:hypothetical protein